MLASNAIDPERIAALEARPVIDPQRIAKIEARQENIIWMVRGALATAGSALVAVLLKYLGV